jgi:hypothetical protein
MGENKGLESYFLWGLAAVLGIFAIVHWVAYFVGPQTWITSWPAIPFTIAAVFAAAGALMMRRKAHRVRLMQK